MVKHDKIFGYVLLILGVALLVFSMVEMFAVYGGSSSPPHLISLSDISMPVPDGSSVTLVSGAQLSQLPNLFFWFILMGFVLLAGGKIASLGVSMIKDIHVEVKEPVSPPKQTQSV